jgi:Cytochrome c
MKRILLFLTVIFLFACSNKKNNPKLFSPEILARQLFSVDVSKDTSLQTLHGSVIRIIAGSFNISGEVQLEIKEAFTPAEMLAAGMTTESNGRPLRSGGMIYINASAKGEAVSLVKSIKVSIPNNFYDSAMQVFKGVETDSAGINWVDPTPLDSTPQSENWMKAKTIFRSKCTSCHLIFKDGTGPALRGLEDRIPNRKKIAYYINNVNRAVSADPYFIRLKRQFGSVMTQFDMPEEEINAILDYIKNESKREGSKEDEDKYQDSLNKLRPVIAETDTSSVDISDGPFKEPCSKKDTLYIRSPKNSVTYLDTTTTNPILNEERKTPLKAEDAEYLRNGFTDPNPTNGMYDFEIETLGWFNVDAYVEGYDGTANVKLWAQVIVDFKIDMHVYLFCPEKKMLSIGYDKHGDKYFFNKINEGIPLFINDRAILFAFGSKGDKMYYGISEFKIKRDQTIAIKINETTDEEIRAALLAKQMNGIDLGLEKKERIIIENLCDESPKKADSIANK